MASEAVDRPLHDRGQPVAVRASGALLVGEFRCSACGYGIVSRAVLPICPMCRGAAWEESPGRLFTRAQEQP